MAKKDFEFNSVSLVGPQWNIEYIPEGLPKRRGGNVQIPYLDGERYAKKLYAPRTDTLNMWVSPFDSTGKIPSGKTAKEQLEINMEYLKGLFGVSGLVPIRKQMPDGTWRKAYAEVANGLEFERKSNGANWRIFSLELIYPDPFWYAEDEITKVYTPSSTSYSCSLNNTGTAPIRKMEIEFEGALVNPKLENLTTGVFIKIAGSISSAVIVTADTEAFTCIDDVAGVNNNWISSLTHSGDTAWFTLNSGSNSLKIYTDEAPAGTVTVKYYPAYF
jgi:hypothetical protein